MRLEDRQIESHEREQDRQREKSPLEHKRTEDLEGMGEDELRGFGAERPETLLPLIRQILENKHQVEWSSLQLPQRELRALEAIQVAVTGRTADKSLYVFAEDRRTMLEQALAVLQPDLVSHAPSALDTVQAELAAVTLQVTELRGQLITLTSAQFTRTHPLAPEAELAETDDEPPQDATPDGSTLYGPEREEPAKPASTLSGPEVKQERLPSTLSGPERKEPAPVPSTLGDPDEIAEVAKKKPWWRRAFGG